MKKETLFIFGSNQKCILTEYRSGAFDISFDFGILSPESQMENANNILGLRNLKVSEIIHAGLEGTFYSVTQTEEIKSWWRRAYDSFSGKPTRVLAHENVIPFDSEKDVARQTHKFR